MEVDILWGGNQVIDQLKIGSHILISKAGREEVRKDWE
jgi:hypothetical protein